MTERINMSHPYPRAFSHLAISVPDIKAAVKFYTEVLGWYLIAEPNEINNRNPAFSEIASEIFGENWSPFQMALLSTGDRIGIELYEFKNQQSTIDSFEYWKSGMFHFSIQDPNLEELVEKVVAAGGKKRMKSPRYLFPGEKPYRIIMMEDPFGNVFDIKSHSFDLQFSAGAYR